MVLHDWLCHSARNSRSFVIVGGKEQSVHGALGALSRRLSAELQFKKWGSQSSENSSSRFE